MPSRRNKINIIACIGLHGEIGHHGKLPWPKIPADMKRFRSLTQGGTLVMGRKTWESLPGIQFDYRRTAVVCSEGAELAIEPDVRLTPVGRSGLAGCVAFGREVGALEGDVWICGGTRIYEEALAFADRVYLTVLEGRFEADAHWPLHLLDPALNDASSPDDVVLPHWRALRAPEPMETPFGVLAFAIDLERI